MTYFDTKFFHLLLTILYVFGVMTATYNPQMKLAKFFHYFVSLVLLASGIMSMQRLGLPLSGDAPFWILAKIICWLGLLTLPMLTIKLAPKHASKANCVFVFIIVVGAFLGVYKP